VAPWQRIAMRSSRTPRWASMNVWAALYRGPRSRRTGGADADRLTIELLVSGLEALAVPPEVSHWWTPPAWVTALAEQAAGWVAAANSLMKVN